MTSTTAVRRSLTAAGCLALTVSFAACAKDDTVDVTDTVADPQSSTATDPQAAGRAGFPGASGEVVARDGSTVQVRNDRTGQVAVTWTDDTTFTATRAATLSDLAVGSCIVVFGGTGDEAATTVTVTRAIDGECQTPAAGGPGAGERPEGFEPPEGMEPPAGMERPSGAPDRGGMPDRGAVTAGKLTAVKDSTLTIGDDTVKVSDDTTVTVPATASASDVTTGVCITAQGEADSTGAVTATTIAVSEKVDGACAAGGFGGGFPGGPGGRPGGADEGDTEGEES